MVGTTAGLGAIARLEQFTKLLDGKSGVADDTTQCECVDGIVARNGQNARPIRHDKVLALSDH